MKRKEFIAFIGPSLLIMILLMVVPLFFTIFLSFQQFSYGITPKFIGLSNYKDILINSRFWNATYFTLIYTLITTPIKLVIGLGVAILLTKITRFRGIFISGSMLPFIVAPVVGTMIFSWLFKEPWGFYSQILVSLGINIHWFATEWPARWLLMFHGVWSGVSFVFLVLFAGLQAMPGDSLEAADIDGANRWQRLWYVILPYLSPLIQFVVLMNIQDSFRLFDSVAIMTRGGPGSATETLMYYNYDLAFGQQSLGAGSAVSILTVIGIFVLMIPSLYKTYKEHKAIK